MSGNRNLSVSTIEYELFSYVDPKLPLLEVFPGARNTKDNTQTVIFCNVPVSIKDKQAIGETIARIEIINRKQDNGVEQIATSKDGSGNVIRWGNMDLERMVMEALFPCEDGYPDDRDLVIGNYVFNLKDVRKQQDKDFTYIMVLLNCTIEK